MSADRVLRKSERCKLLAAGTSKVSEPEAKNARVTIGGTKFMADGKAGSKNGFQMPASRAKDTFSTVSIRLRRIILILSAFTNGTPRHTARENKQGRLFHPRSGYLKSFFAPALPGQKTLLSAQVRMSGGESRISGFFRRVYSACVCRCSVVIMRG